MRRLAPLLLTPLALLACGGGDDASSEEPALTVDGDGGASGASGKGGSPSGGGAGKAQGGAAQGGAAQGGQAGQSAQGGQAGQSAQGGQAGQSAQGGQAGQSAQGGQAGQSAQGGQAGQSAQGGQAGAAGKASQGGAGQGGEAQGGQAGQGSSAGQPAQGGQGGSAGEAGVAGAAGAAGAGGQVFEPSPANPGWVGGACESAADCTDVEGAVCLQEGYPNGMCTTSCELFCPDRTGPADTPTFCIDGLAGGLGHGMCVSKCDAALLPPDGCAQGYRCELRNRYAQPATVESVCVPAQDPSPCSQGDLLIDVDYPDKGALFIPSEARCGGAFDLVVMLHGINPSSNPTPSLGGGRRLELEVRALIDAGLMKPVVLAEPVHFQGSSTNLYGSEYSLTAHLDLLMAELSARGITLSSLSYTGHSGAGCDASNGLYKVLDEWQTLVPAYAPSMKLWGLMDVCYESAYHWEAPLAALPQMGAAMVNVYSVQGDPTAFEQAMFADGEAMPCDDTLYHECLRDKVRPWCSVRTNASAGIGHDNNPYFFVREVFPQVFSTDPAREPCR